VFLNFDLWVKDPYKPRRHLVRVSLLVPTEEIEAAREAITPGTSVQIRIGELYGMRTKSGGVFMTIHSKWKWVEVLKAMPTGQRKEYQDI